MKFLHCLAFDVKEGMRSVAPWFLIVACLQILLSLVMHFEATEYLDPNTTLSLGDHLAYAISGTKEYDPGSGTRIDIPLSWMLLLLLMAYIPLVFPYRNLMGIGKYYVMASQSRWAWWLSKCCWVSLCAANFWVASLAGMMLSALVQGDPLSLSINDSFPALIGCDFRSLNEPPYDLTANFFCIIPASMALCMLQLSVSLFSRPIFAYLTTIAIGMFSLLFASPAAPGNWLMIARSQALIDGGIDPIACITSASLLFAVSVIAGGIGFNKKDIIEKEHEQ